MEEIPYHQLAKIGISREDILNFPKPVLDPFISGGVTPLLVAKIPKSYGQSVSLPLKLQLLRSKSGDVRVVAYPMRKEVLNDHNFSPRDLEKLSRGEILRKEVSEQGKRSQRYYQLDNETNSIMQKDAPNLRLSDRIKEIEKLGHIELGLNQKKSILEGKPVELQLNDSVITVGVDLKQPVGFKNLQGDLKDWETAKLLEYDRVHPGFMGYVKTDANRWEYQQVLNHLQSRNAPERTEKTMKQSL